MPCLLRCAKKGEEVRIESNDGEADYYSLSTAWMVSAVFRRFFKLKVSLCTELDDVDDELKYFLAQLQNKKVVIQPDIGEGNNIASTGSQEGIAFLLPQKIRPYFTITKKKINSDNTLIYGELTCCDAHELEVQIAGKVKRSLISGMYLYPEDDAIALAVRCKRCGKEISVFNGATDGYDRVDVKPQEKDEVKPFICRKCADNNFTVRIRYEYPDAQELEELGLTQIDKAFTWIWITLECNTCGRKYKKLVDFETA